MSHRKLREEKNCLNCGAIVEERFCPHCGQENLQLQDSAFHLIIHYIQDMFHYDGRFWHTLKMLVLKPGQVAREYVEGKRTRNLEPLRFYVFASTVFFILLFYMLSKVAVNEDNDPKLNYRKRIYNIEQERKYLEGSPDTAYAVLLKKGLTDKLDSLHRASGDTTDYVSLSELPIPESKDTSFFAWLGNWLNKRAEDRRKELLKEHEGDESGIFTDIISEAVHKLPQLLFVSLPFFALILKLLYIRPKRNYVEHFIFSIYFYAYLFVIMSLIFIFQFIETENTTFQAIMANINGGLVLYIFIYLLLAMKRFYTDRWRWLIPRYMVLIFLYFFLIFILFLIGVVISYLW